MQKRPKGVITIYLSLVFLVMISLITGCIFSVKVEAGRFQAANALDQAMFSLFAHYDQPLLQKYDLFMIDGSCQTDRLRIHSCLDEVNDVADQILSFGSDLSLSQLSGSSKLLTLKRTGSSVTGYTLATDVNCAAFEAQAIQSVYDTLGTTAVSQLLSSFGKQSTDNLQNTSPFETDGEIPEAVEVPEDFINPIPILTTLKSMSLLKLVFDDEDQVSQNTIRLSDYFSGRTPESGFGVINTMGHISSQFDRMVFNLYIAQHFSNACDPLETSLLQYQEEYILAGKSSDRENLETVLKKILVMREAVNLSFLLTDPGKQAELSETALLIASLLGNPELIFMIKTALAVGWAYLESIEDLHSLMNGNRIPTMKTALSWQVNIRNIPSFLTDREVLEKPAAAGMNYEDFLNLFLTAELNTSQTVSRACDMIEADLRGSGFPLFRMDHCIDSFSVEMEVLSENQIPLTVTQQYSYRTIKEAERDGS